MPRTTDRRPGQRAENIVSAPVAQAAASLCSAPALWMDETHYPREGIANWVWTAVQPLLAVFAIYPSRARYVILDFIGERCTAAVTTDRYAGYAFIDAERRQVCWAHLLRDFNRIGQRQGLAGQIGRRLLGLGLLMFRKRDKGLLEGAMLDGLQRRLRAALLRGVHHDRCSRTSNTCARNNTVTPSKSAVPAMHIVAPSGNTNPAIFGCTSSSTNSRRTVSRRVSLSSGAMAFSTTNLSTDTMNDEDWLVPSRLMRPTMR